VGRLAAAAVEPIVPDRRELVNGKDLPYGYARGKV